jgi:hypothetical protein
MNLALMLEDDFNQKNTERPGFTCPKFVLELARERARHEKVTLSKLIKTALLSYLVANNNNQEESDE